MKILSVLRLSCLLLLLPLGAMETIPSRSKKRRYQEDSSNRHNKKTTAEALEACKKEMIDTFVYCYKHKRINLIANYLNQPAYKEAPLDFVDRLVKEKIDLNTQDRDDGSTLTYAAVWLNNPVFLEKLLSNKADPNIPTTINKSYPIHLAALRRNAECLELLLKHDAKHDVLCQWDDEGNTPLHIAVKRCSLRCVNILLDYDAHPEVLNDNFKTPIDVAHALNNSGTYNTIIKTIREKIKHPLISSLSEVDILEEGDC